MNNRLKKDQIIEILSNFKLDAEEYWLLSSSALVLREIYPDAGDIDIAVTEKGLKELENNYSLRYKDNGWFVVNEIIEGVCDGSKSNLKYLPEKIGKYYVQNIKDYYDYLLTSDRQKDKDRIPLVKEYIDKNCV